MIDIYNFLNQINPETNLDSSTTWKPSHEGRDSECNTYKANHFILQNAKIKKALEKIETNSKKSGKNILELFGPGIYIDPKKTFYKLSNGGFSKDRVTGFVQKSKSHLEIEKRLKNIEFENVNCLDIKEFRRAILLKDNNFDLIICNPIGLLSFDDLNTSFETFASTSYLFLKSVYDKLNREGIFMTQIPIHDGNDGFIGLDTLIDNYKFSERPIAEFNQKFYTFLKDEYSKVGITLVYDNTFNSMGIIKGKNAPKKLPKIDISNFLKTIQ